MPNIRWLLAWITAAHRFVYEGTGGRLGGRLPGGRRFLLLTTVGRRTGKRRVLPLLYVRDGDCFVVAGSNAGDDRPPAWWLNLEAQPTARVQVGEAQHEVEARRAQGEELARLWSRLDAAYGFFPAYREKAAREIPVVLLQPTQGSG